jgi:anti-sigma B factor antagonist
MATASESDCGSAGRRDDFAVDAALDPPRMTLALKGELDLAGAPSLEREIEALPWPQLAELVVDLAELTFIDSTGLSVLIRASQRAAAEGLLFSVVRAPMQPRRLFSLAGVTAGLNVLPLEPSDPAETDSTA